MNLNQEVNMQLVIIKKKKLPTIEEILIIIEKNSLVYSKTFRINRNS